MMQRIEITAAVLFLAGSCLAEESPPEPFDLDAALARQSASDLISGVSIAYDCAVAMHSMRQLGTQEQPVYLVQVSMSGTECEDALLLLSRHGSTKDFVFRRWAPGPDMEQVDPVAPGDEFRPQFDPDSNEE